MKAKRALIIFGVVALAAALLLLALGAYWVLLAMVVGLLLVGSREIWSLIKYQRLPVFDERVRGNLVKAVRNAGVFFVIAAIFLMLVLSGNLLRLVPAARIVGLLFVSVGAAYVFSYVYYDRAEPNLDEKALRWLRRFIITAGTAVGVFIVSGILHNLIGGVSGIEEPVFFVIAVIICPVAVGVGLLGSLALLVKGLIGNLRRDDEESEADENEG
ncbi:MAG: hypothetical protein KAX25_01135 [Dehalococcoidia bacterium]|nr:hypothetical protein [Dehalococcoidia bacterium]